jgi:hypothetical protein
VAQQCNDCPTQASKELFDGYCACCYITNNPNSSTSLYAHAKENAVCSFSFKTNEQTAFSFACAYKDVGLFGFAVL